MGAKARPLCFKSGLYDLLTLKNSWCYTICKISFPGSSKKNRRLPTKTGYTSISRFMPVTIVNYRRLMDVFKKIETQIIENQNNK